MNVTFKLPQHIEAHFAETFTNIVGHAPNEQVLEKFFANWASVLVDELNYSDIEMAIEEDFVEVE
jgi:hypothetical protein